MDRAFCCALASPRIYLDMTLKIRVYSDYV